MHVGWMLASIAAAGQHRHASVRLLLAAVVAVCVWRCQVRNVEWADADSLYAAALQVCPQSARINNNIGTRYESTSCVESREIIQNLQTNELHRAGCAGPGCCAPGKQQIPCHFLILQYKQYQYFHWHYIIGDLSPSFAFNRHAAILSNKYMHHFREYPCARYRWRCRLDWVLCCF